MGKNKKYVTIQKAATKLGKSTRTIRRYLDKLDIDTKQSICQVSQGKVLILESFIDSLGAKKESQEAPKIAQKKEVEPKERTSEENNKTALLLEKQNNDLRSQIGSLESRNKELFQMVKEKDQQISENIQDFKTLTSKVLFLQNEILQIGETSKGHTAPKTQIAKEPTAKDSTLFVIAFLLFAILVMVAILMLI
jgi:hypothetical protein